MKEFCLACGFIYLMFSTAAALAQLAWAANVSAEIIAGEQLSKPLTLALDFSAGHDILVTALQDRADLVLTLRDIRTGLIVRKVSFTSEKRLPEVLYVRADDCQNCELSIEGLAAIDRSSAYQISISMVPQNQPKNDSKRLTLNSILKHITKAGELRHLAESNSADQRDDYLRQSASELEIIATAVVAEEHQNWRHHAMILLAETRNYLGDADGRTDLLSKIVAESQGKASDYLALAYFRLGARHSNAEQARELYDQGMALTRGVKPGLYAMGANYKAISLVRAGQHEAALKLLNEVYDIYTQRSSWRMLMDPLHNLGWASLRAGDMPAALAYATQQRLFAEQYRDEENIIWALYNFGLTYGKMGEHYLSDKFLTEALARQTRLPVKSRSSTAHLKGYILEEKTLGLLEFGALDLAADTAEIMKHEFEQQAHPSRIIEAVVLEGRIAMEQKKFAKARVFFNQALAFNADNNRTQERGRVQLKLAELTILERDYVAAAPHMVAALKLLSQAEEYLHLARAFSQAVELLHRLDANQDAMALIKRTQKFIEQHGLEKEHARFFYRKALVERALGNNQSALENLNIAKSKVEKILSNTKRRGLRQTYLGLQKTIFEATVANMLELAPEQTRAPLALAEAFKARTLTERINSINRDKALSQAQSDSRNLLLKKIQANAKLWYGGGEARPSVILSSTRSLSAELEKIEADINQQRVLFSQNSDLFEQQGRTAIGSGVSNIGVSPKEIIAYYFTGNDSSWLWVITSAQQDVYRLPGEQRIGDLVDTYIATVSSPPASRPGVSKYDQFKAVTDLSNVVLKPLAAHLQSGDFDQLTIIPDGPLQGLPFSPLSFHDNNEPLVTQFSFTYAPSLGSRDALNRRSKKRDQPLVSKALVVANPFNSQTIGASLPALPFSVIEAQAIQQNKRWDTSLYMSKDAQKKNVLLALQEPHSIWHFATHGVLNETEPALSGLLFSDSQDQDNLWLTHEISASNISAELVVLSACETSVGKHVSGEGLFSLSRAFIEGGANQVVGTLWKVQDKTTSVLMSEFYSHLLDGNLGTAKALQKAQKAIYLNQDNDWTDPYYWAGFQFLGGGEKVGYASRAN